MLSLRLVIAIGSSALGLDTTTVNVNAPPGSTFVSGLAALIRARFPTLTARQVMQRIESSAHHPPGGWNPFVGNGAVDVLAAVSTDANPTGNTPMPPTPVPLSSPPAPRPPNSPGRGTALRGATGCLVALVAVLLVGAAKARLPGWSRATRDGVSGD